MSSEICAHSTASPLFFTEDEDSADAKVQDKPDPSFGNKLA